MWKAYKQIPIAEAQRSHLHIKIYSPHERQWKLVESYVLAFGIAGSVLHFNRIPAFAVAFLRRVLAIPTQSFYEDFRLLEFEWGAASALVYLDKFAKLLGIKFDDKKQQGPCTRLEMLGNIENFSRAGFDEASVEARGDRLQAISDEIDAVLECRRIASGQAASLRGQLLHIAQTRPARTGRLPLLELAKVADGKVFGWSSKLEWDLIFARRAMDLPHVKLFPLGASEARRTYAFTDASFEPGRGSTPGT